MRYLTLAANHLEPSVTGEAAELSSLEELGLSRTLTDEVRAWNARYQTVVPLPVVERFAVADEIERLDQAGLELAGRIATELAPAKVKYYSEEFLRDAGQRASEGQGR